MIIEKIALENFGLFKEKTLIHLEPSVETDRNVIIISGKNGVGKSTLQEAIHVSLLGALSIDSRVSEANYESYLLTRSYQSNDSHPRKTSLELFFNFIKSGVQVNYKIIRQWNNTADNVNEEVFIEENGIELKELSKKEKNIFLRELIQPGFSKVMFFDGEKLSSLFESTNLSQFIEESCKDLFGLNFVELLKTDLNYYTNKLLLKQGNQKNVEEWNKISEELEKIEDEIQSFLTTKDALESQLQILKESVIIQEQEISKQGRGITKRLDKIKTEKQKLETTVDILKKEILEQYSSLGPFIFCKNLCLEVRNRLIIERSIEKWHHAKELLTYKADQVKKIFEDTSFTNELFIHKKNIKKLLVRITESLLSKPPSFLEEETIHHPIADNERSRIIAWVDAVTGKISEELKAKTSALIVNEAKIKDLNKEQATFSKDDIIHPLVTQLQDLNRKIGALELQVTSIEKKINEQLKRKEYYNSQLVSAENKLMADHDVNSKLHLSHKTKLALEDYSKELLSRKIELLEKNILQKFNFLCRKEEYLEAIKINPNSFEVSLQINGTITEHRQLSAGEKQLFILSVIWGLRTLTNVNLPLIIDTPIARLDLEHRTAFVTDFLPSIRPQVILMGTDTEIMDEMLEPVKGNIHYHYQFVYNRKAKANQVILKEDEAFAKSA